MSGVIHVVVESRSHARILEGAFSEDFVVVDATGKGVLLKCNEIIA